VDVHVVDRFFFVWISMLLCVDCCFLLATSTATVHTVIESQSHRPTLLSVQYYRHEVKLRLLTKQKSYRKVSFLTRSFTLYVVIVICLQSFSSCYSNNVCTAVNCCSIHWISCIRIGIVYFGMNPYDPGVKEKAYTQRFRYEWTTDPRFKSKFTALNRAIDLFV